MSSRQKLWLSVAGLLGAAAVILGALGSHLWAARLDEIGAQRYRLASVFHLAHVLMLLAILLIARDQRDNAWFVASRWLCVTGLILFCGSLYGRALGGPGWIAHVAPFGGISLILAWFALAAAPWKTNKP